MLRYSRSQLMTPTGRPPNDVARQRPSVLHSASTLIVHSDACVQNHLT